MKNEKLERGVYERNIDYYFFSFFHNISFFYILKIKVLSGKSLASSICYFHLEQSCIHRKKRNTTCTKVFFFLST